MSTDAIKRIRTTHPHDVAVGDVLEVLAMLKHGDLIHVDEVPGYVLRGRKEAYRDALVDSLRSSWETA